MIRQKWHVGRRNVMVGDVVLIQDTNVLRGEWRMGVVTSTFPGLDGRVRRVTVSYKNFRPDERRDHYDGANFTDVERPVHRLIVLLAFDDNETN